MVIKKLKDFEKYISENNICSDVTFDLESENLRVTKLKSIWVQFANCTFNCKELSFNNIILKTLSLEFESCTFNCKVAFSDCTFGSLSFKNTKEIQSLEISNLKLHDLVFSNDLGIERPELTSEFTIRRSNIDFLIFEKLNHKQGRLRFLGNKFGEKGNTSFQNSTLTNVLFGQNSFSGFSSFKRMHFKSTPEYSKPIGAAFEFPGFYKNTFSKVSFSESHFINTFQFENCDFLSTTWFEECKNLSNTKLKFVACEFKGFSLFNKSKINFLNIDRCTFAKSSSFTDAEFNTLKLFEVKFGGGAYFDEMKIHKVLDRSYLKDKSKILEWKRSLRAIKQESQKAENRIDFNRFRAYELAAHYEELDWKWNSGFIDKSILYVTKISTDFGNSWRKALRFTVIGGFLIYLLLYILENWDFQIDISNWDNWARLFSGFFRFLLVTDFYNPLETDRVYLTNPFSWLIFIFGKIVIAFGIYEMIQSFRKFKA